MRYLLDVNALLAFGFVDHQFHARVVAWLRSEDTPQLMTCSITELGFVRVLTQVRASGYTVPQARALLLEMKSDPEFPLVFHGDENDISRLPTWVQTPGQTTDGHLLALAKAHNAELATFDSKIPGAFLIP